MTTNRWLGIGMIVVGLILVGIGLPTPGALGYVLTGLGGGMIGWAVVKIKDNT